VTDLPVAGMEDWDFTQGFYYGLSQEAKEHIDNLAGGTFWYENQFSNIKNTEPRSRPVRPRSEAAVIRLSLVIEALAWGGWLAWRRQRTCGRMGRGR
jgi:hypothetical protein